MKNYRTAQGKTVDMAALAAKNERTRAVGNMKVNARGDTIDADGKILVPVTQKVGAKYQATVGNKSAQPVKNNKPKHAVKEPKPAVTQQPELTNEELELDSSFEDDLEVEQIKARETKK
jgi:hypothetical protein